MIDGKVPRPKNVVKLSIFSTRRDKDLAEMGTNNMRQMFRKISQFIWNARKICKLANISLRSFITRLSCSACEWWKIPPFGVLIELKGLSLLFRSMSVPKPFLTLLCFIQLRQWFPRLKMELEIFRKISERPKHQCIIVIEAQSVGSSVSGSGLYNYVRCSCTLYVLGGLQICLLVLSKLVQALQRWGGKLSRILLISAPRCLRGGWARLQVACSCQWHFALSKILAVQYIALSHAQQ